MTGIITVSAPNRKSVDIVVGKECYGFHSLNSAAGMVRELLEAASKRREPISVNYWPGK
jgi:hypothetical protein